MAWKNKRIKKKMFKRKNEKEQERKWEGNRKKPWSHIFLTLPYMQPQVIFIAKFNFTLYLIRKTTYITTLITFIT